LGVPARTDNSQIPFGDDNQKIKCNDNGKYHDNDKCNDTGKCKCKDNGNDTART
jgi:hypothetical protein